MHRREFIAVLGSAAATSSLSWPLPAHAQQTRQPETAAMATLKKVRTKVLEIAYEESGPENGAPVLLMHGFPYDPRAYDEVVPRLVASGCRTIVPYLRGYGQTRFLSDQGFAAFGTSRRQITGVPTLAPQGRVLSSPRRLLATPCLRFVA